MKYLITPLDGIGDQLYTRPIIKRLVADQHQVWLKCGLPELFSDLKVKFCEFNVNSRTQLKSVSRVKFVPEPVADRVIAPRYNLIEFMQYGVTGALEHGCGYVPKEGQLVWDLPPLPELMLKQLPTNKPIAVVKANTLRREWTIPARNPSTKHLAEVTAHLRAKGYYVVSIADVEPPFEWFEGPEPEGDLKLHRGEGGVLGMLALFQRADLVVGGPSVVIPGAISAQTNLLIVWGGRGYYDCPELLLDERMDHSKIAHLMPDRFCKCRQRMHSCDKNIGELSEKLDTILKGWFGS